jgi:DNA mismatch endonuclease (patch repair protein)
MLEVRICLRNLGGGCAEFSLGVDRGGAMADTRSAEQRRRIMQAVKTRDTGPELSVRRLLHRLGYRYRLNVQTLPGRPDIVFTRLKRAIFVHGCFWHGHGCLKGQAPKSRLDYWAPKLDSNKERDAAQLRALEELGWSVLTVWQCETRDLEALEMRLRRFLGGRLNIACNAS